MLCSALAFELCFLSYASCKSHRVLSASIVSLGKQRSYRKAASSCPNDINIRQIKYFDSENVCTHLILLHSRKIKIEEK